MELLGEGRLRGVVPPGCRAEHDRLELLPRREQERRAAGRSGGREEGADASESEAWLAVHRVEGGREEVLAIEAVVRPFAELSVAGDVLDRQRVARLPGRGVDHRPLAQVDQRIRIVDVDVEWPVAPRLGARD